jgi:hypothetical protein
MPVRVTARTKVFCATKKSTMIGSRRDGGFHLGEQDAPQRAQVRGSVDPRRFVEILRAIFSACRRVTK